MKTVGVTTCQADVGADMILIGSNDDVWILMAAGFILEYGGKCVVCCYEGMRRTCNSCLGLQF